VALGVDEASNVTVLGLGTGQADLEGPVSFEPPDAAQALSAGFLLRLDSNGSLVFRDVFTSDQSFFGSLSLAVSPSGVSTVIASALGNVSFGAPASGNGAEAGSASSYEGGTAVPTRFLFQLDTLGQILGVTPAPYFPTGIQAGADGTLWMLDNANAADGGAGGLGHFSPTASPLWTRPVSGTAFAVGGPGAIVFDNSHQATVELQAVASDGTLLWSQPPTPYNVPTEDYSLAVDPNGNIIVAGYFPVPSAQAVAPSPTSPLGIGYETFDPGGVLRSVNVFGGAPDAASGQRFLGVAADPSGNVLVAGTQQNGWATTGLFVDKFAPSAFDGAADGCEGE
jgi:hypothetical protein